MFKKVKFSEKFNYENIYPTTHDAVLHIFHRRTSHDMSPMTEKKMEEVNELFIEYEKQTLTDSGNPNITKISSSVCSL